MRGLVLLAVSAAAHYGPPPCGKDEMTGNVGGGQIACAPKCNGQSCPSDVPPGVTAQPTCALQDQSGQQYCALVCSSDDQCGSGKCTNMGPAGVCTYSAGGLQAPSKLGVSKDVVFASSAVQMFTRLTADGVRNGLLLLFGFTGDVKYTPHKELIADGQDILQDVDHLVGLWKNKEATKFRETYNELSTKLGAEKIDLLKKFNEFLHKFQRKYKSTDEACAALKTFISNLQTVKMHQAADKSATYSHLSPLADMRVETFNKRNNLNTQGMNEVKSAPKAGEKELDSLPASIDWRQKGAVNAVKNQGQCGSCWAFCTVANIEGANVVQGKGELLSLSEQELVDCSTNDMGCNGGLPARAYTDMIQGNMGLELESVYGYHSGGDGQAGRCQKDSSKYKVFIADYVQISKNEKEMAAALVKYGPLAIAMNANQMQFYAGGIADPSANVCNPNQLNHGVTLVGFGSTDGTDYWNIRNSWGPEWGEEGYYRITRGKSTCGVNTLVTSAVMSQRQREIIV